MAVYTPKFSFHEITEITPEFLREQGIRGLLLDVDNTLTYHDDPTPIDRIADWVEARKQEGFVLVIYSNNHPPRVAPFAEKLGLGYIADAGKPGTRGFLEAVGRYRISAGQWAVVGDQLFTDIAAGNRNHAVSILVDPLGPEILLRVKVKRVLEKLVYRRR